MGFELLQHQHEGVDFLMGRGAGLLAFEQGLGKTFVAIEAFRRLLDGGRADRLLVICPNSLKRNWVAEFSKFAPSVLVDVAEGSPKSRRTTFHESRARVVVTSYETARAETTALLALAQRQRTVLVLDESHAAKNWRSQTSTAARTIAPYCKFRWLLSGTPVTNTAMDLFTQVEIIEPGRGSLGSLESFTARLEDDPEASFAKTSSTGWSCAALRTSASISPRSRSWTSASSFSPGSGASTTRCGTRWSARSRRWVASSIEHSPRAPSRSSPGSSSWPAIHRLSFQSWSRRPQSSRRSTASSLTSSPYRAGR
ncbi:MAG: DEAD/DEAH box helicase family protein [Candidatus Competibacteraceae bacterium]|nr:DEAD/DEAH box helicase family protein [Candidatus Competibacteraceae bacterium]